MDSQKELGSMKLFTSGIRNTSTDTLLVWLLSLQHLDIPVYWDLRHRDCHVVTDVWEEDSTFIFSATHSKTNGLESRIFIKMCEQLKVTHYNIFQKSDLATLKTKKFQPSKTESPIGKWCLTSQSTPQPLLTRPEPTSHQTRLLRQKRGYSIAVWTVRRPQDVN